MAQVERIRRRGETQEILDRDLSRAPDDVRHRFEAALSGTSAPSATTPRDGYTPRQAPRKPPVNAPDSSAEPSDSDWEKDPDADNGHLPGHALTAGLRELLHDTLTAREPHPSGYLMAGIEQMRASVDHTLAGGGPPTSAQVDNLAATVQASATQCVFMPPMAMVCRLLLDLADVQELLIRRQRPPVQQNLYAVTAQLATLIADELTMLGDVRQSRAWHATARFAADQTTDTALKADVRTLAAVLPLYYGDFGEAVTLAREARKVGGGSPSLSTALAPTYEALALAQLGDGEGSQAALSLAREQMERLAPTHQVESVFGFSERRWRFYARKVLLVVPVDQRRAAPVQRYRETIRSCTVAGK